MKIALIVLRPDDEKAFTAFLLENQLEALPRVMWRVTEPFLLAEQLLTPLEAVFSAAPATLLLFPASREGDELATRLAWRLKGSAVCRASHCHLVQKQVTKAAYGSAMTATLSCDALPLCLSLLNATGRAAPLDTTEQITLSPQPLGHSLSAPEQRTLPVHPLQSAKYVLATGQGACDQKFSSLAERLDAEPGYTRQRIMAGNGDEQRMLGVSGQSIAPEVCLIAGASGASAFMAGVNQSRFIVAINTDPAAPLFAAADVGIVDDAQAVLEALVACRDASG